MPKPELTLDQVWERCLKMWEWIANEKMRHPERHVFGLKYEWLEANYPPKLEKNCFFCDWAQDDCEACPGKEVDPEFNCMNPSYHYYDNPIEFAAKLERLNSKREATK